jgi:hypothetical protein
MQINRRHFIKTAGGVALATFVPPLPGLLGSEVSLQKEPGRIRVAVFAEESFPDGEINRLPAGDLQNTLDFCDIRFLSSKEIITGLNTSAFDLFVNPYGSHFPKEAFNCILSFLANGGNWINLGGVPFSVPVVKENSGWRKEVATTAYHKKLGITQAFPVDGKKVVSYVAAGERSVDIKGGLHFSADEIYELYVRFTVVKDFPSEDGTGGPRDAVLHPLVWGMSEAKRKIVAPFIQINRLQGNFAGGRWILANYKGSINTEAVRMLVANASCGGMELTARSSFACYREGEMPSVTIQFRAPHGNVEELLDNSCSIQVLTEARKSVETLRLKLLGKGAVATGTIDLKGKRYSPGVYQIYVSQSFRTSSHHSDTIHYSTGFWVYDTSLMEQGTPLTTDSNYFLRDGETYPVTGTTYMGSDVHRKFLFEPNPFVWDKDFAAMKRDGVNMIRTGIWTGWKNYMLDIGAPNETALRAMDAFVLTARKYDIPLIFTFFAFLPESWGGANPYLDPRSVNAQKEFITIFSHRYRMVNDIIWDFINEPSFSSPSRLWQCRPNYDEYEVAAWNSWLKEKYPASTEAERVSRLQELYRCSADEAIALPRLEEFDDANIFNDRRPIKVIDYRLFAQEMFTRWVKEMTSAIRSNGNRNQLITVGQDEGGTYERPGNHFFGDAVDVTSLHNWWLNDDLLWDNVITKAPGKANLVEETGVMFYENMDGTPWRTEYEAASLLGRKITLSLGAGAAGCIQWIWNTNCYMTLDNESAIGFHRVDGTAKPELTPFITAAKFFAEHKHLMKQRQEEDVVMVIPHSQMFSVRNFATEATKKCVRAMQYYCDMPVKSVSEYRLSSLRIAPKLIIIPSPRTFNETAREQLMSIVQKGSTLLITGPFNIDDHWMLSTSKQIIGGMATAPIAQEEFLRIGEQEFRLSFRGDKLQRVEKAVGEKMNELLVRQEGEGKILWTPFPVELSESIEPTVALYRYALVQANIQPYVISENKNASVLIYPTIFADAVLYTIVSESGKDESVKFTQRESNTVFEIAVPAQKSLLMFVGRSNGKILSQCYI